MKWLAAAVAVALAGFAGTARADTFTPLAAAPTALAAAPFLLPSAEVPNDGLLVLPLGWTEASSSLPRELSYAELLALWTRAGEAYGIPWQVLAAINKIETNFGGNMGPSSAGAVGWMQFMPDTWLRWGLDASGDRIADPWSPEDAVYAAARYLAAAGGRTDIERGVYAYNHADWYVRDVLQLAEMYGGGGLDVTGELDPLHPGLEQAQAQVAAINEQLVEATEEARRLELAEQRLVDRADGTRLLSDSLVIRQSAGALGARRAAAEAQVEALRARLSDAESALEQARTGTSPFPGPSYNGSYAFPVGGGPGVVSVSHHHHDYPAADIAAPAGAPVYALADAVVERSWALASGACGIGATIQTADGQTWTYCHLSYLDPAVVAGALLTAGTPIGLVGSTGHSTGPHLHLQLQPATSYPQLQMWFSAFAGTAFSWQDGDPGGVWNAGTAFPSQYGDLGVVSNAATGSGPVFAVVQDEAPAPLNSVITFTR